MLERYPAHQVLTDHFLLLHIGSFQSGLPRDVVELARARLASVDSNGDLLWKAGGLLAAVAIKDNDLPLLKRLYRYHQQQPVYQTDPRYMTFRRVWYVCLKYGDLVMLQWIHSQPALRRTTPSHASDELYRAFANPNPEVVKWVLTNRPEYKTEFWTDHLRHLVALGGRLPLLRWLETNVPNLPYDASVMDEAAGAGDLDMVQYLHDTRATDGCTKKAMDTAAKKGHLHVVRFLHENRTEGCTTSAMDNAATKGHFKVVQFLHEYRTEGCTADAMDSAAEEGHLEVVRFLHETARKDVQCKRQTRRPISKFLAFCWRIA